MASSGSGTNMAEAAGTVGNMSTGELSDIVGSASKPSMSQSPVQRNTLMGHTNRAEALPSPGSNVAKTPGGTMPNPTTASNAAQKLEKPKMPNQPNPYAFGADASGFANAGMVPPALKPMNPPPLPNPEQRLPDMSSTIGRGAQPGRNRLSPLRPESLARPQQPVRQRYGQAQAAPRRAGEQLRGLMALAATNSIRKNQQAQSKKSRKPMGKLWTYLDTLSRS